MSRPARTRCSSSRPGSRRCRRSSSWHAASRARSTGGHFDWAGPARDGPRCRRADDQAGLDRRHDPHRRDMPGPGLRGTDRRELRHRSLRRASPAAAAARGHRRGRRWLVHACSGRLSVSVSRLSPISSRRRPAAIRRKLFPAVASTLRRYRGRSPGAWTVPSPPSRRASTISSAGPVPRAGMPGDDAIRPAQLHACRAAVHASPASTWRHTRSPPRTGGRGGDSGPSP